jgi:hypothetical protein
MERSEIRGRGSEQIWSQPRCASLHPGYGVIQLSNSPMHMSAHVHHRPCSPLGAGLAVSFPYPLPQKERAERLGEDRARGARMPTGSPHADFLGQHTSGGPTATARSSQPNRAEEADTSPAFRTRMDFAACSMSQGWSLPPTSPRSCELSPGHALGPSARYAGVSPGPLEDPKIPLQFPRPGIVAATASPLRAAMTIATRPLSVRDANRNIH